MSGRDAESHWERWTGESGPFYTACAVWPRDDREEEAANRPEATFTTGVTRLALRNLPTFLLAVLAVYVPITAWNLVRTGRLAIAVPSLTLETVALAVPAVVVAGLWTYLLYRIVAGPIRTGAVHRSIVFFATALPLAAGTVYATYTAWGNVGSGAEPAATVQAGYFLFVLVTGHLAYDGLVLRTEHLLDELRGSGIVDQSRYEEFYAELTEMLGDSVSVGPVRLPRSVGFALGLALVPIALPVFAFGWGPIDVLGYVPYSLVTLFVIAVLYDVFVLVYAFTDLLRRDILEYQPFHPDEHGGFRDLGRFATRVNAILLVAGGYVAYRLYSEGVLNIPTEGFASTFVALTWGVLYLGPIAAYVVLVLFWLYHSFWRLHRKMEEGRRRRMEELQRRARDRTDDPAREFADLDADAPPWESLQAAPTWPIKRQSLLGILAVDAVPVVLTFVL
jgi:hypothetical protein